MAMTNNKAIEAVFKDIRKNYICDAEKIIGEPEIIPLVDGIIKAYLQHYLDAPEGLAKIIDNELYDKNDGKIAGIALKAAKSILNAMIGELDE